MTIAPIVTTTACVPPGYFGSAAWGIPAIANDIGGIHETTGEGGILIRPAHAQARSRETLVRRYDTEIERVLNDMALYETLSRKASLRAAVYRTEQQEMVKKALGNFMKETHDRQSLPCASVQ